MAGINSKKIENLVKLPARDRYFYFIRKVVDFESVWGLYDDGWAMLSEGENRALAFWPEEELAKLCANGIWAKYESKQISLEDFRDKWVPGMIKDGMMAAIFYTPNGKGITISAKQLDDDLAKESEQYS